MTKIRVMFVGQGASLLPEDRFVNVFHFFAPIGEADATAQTAARAWVNAFYTSTGVGGNALGQFISPYVMRAAQLISYDLDEAEPRTPTPQAMTLPGAVGAGMPEEVAICLSIEGAPPHTPRRRGRIYFGPITDSATAVIMGSTTQPARPAKASAAHLVPLLLDRAEVLMSQSITAGVPWCIRSTVPSENFVPVVSGWVDDAFDTQRRRGPNPTSRLTFT